MFYPRPRRLGLPLIKKSCLLPEDPLVRRQAWFIALFNALMLLWLVLKPAPHAVHVAVDDLMGALGPLLMPLWTLSQLFRQRSHTAEGRSRFWVPLCLSLGSFSYGLGMMTWTYLEVVRHQAVLFPSLADAWYLAGYPFLFLGVLLLPLRPCPPALRGRVLLDSLMTMTALVTFSWYFVLGPTFLGGGPTLLAKVLGPAYPLADLALLFCVLVLSAHGADDELRPAIRALSLGLLVIVVADTIYGYMGIKGTYATGGVIDVLWPVGYMTVTLGGVLVWQRQGRSVERPDQHGAVNPVLWRSLLPYALVPPVGALLLYTAHRHGDEKLETGVYIGSAILVGLILLRQIFAIMENSHLNRFLRDAHAELEMKNRSLGAANARLEGLAVTDGLTGLKNHRAFQEQIEQECQRAARHGTPLSLLLLDVDRFKKYNDTFGHPAGDGVLKDVARALSEQARDSDFVARYGGEEFVVILPHTDAEGARAVAERFREAVAAITGVERPVTASFGATTMTPAVCHGADLMVQADEALYRAKAAGRNCVCHHGDRSEIPNAVPVGV